MVINVSDQSLNQLETIIYNVGGIKLLREIKDGVIYNLYSFSNGLYLIMYKKEETIKIKLGKLRMLDEDVLCLFVLEDYDMYLKSLYKLNIIKKKIFINLVDSLKENLELIFKHYKEIINDSSWLNNVNRLNRKLSDYNIKELTYMDIEEVIKNCKDKTKGTGFHLEIDNLFKKETIMDVLLYQFGEIGVGLLFILIDMGIILIINTFTNIDMSTIPVEVDIILSGLVLVLLGFVLFIVKYFRKKKMEKKL